MDEKFDHGPVVSQFKEEILPTDTYETLRDRLFSLSAEVLVQALPTYLKGKINLKAQDDSKASFARMVNKEDAYIPPKFLVATLKGLTLQGKWKVNFIKDHETTPTPEVVERFIRAMDPWPVAWTEIKIPSGKNIKKLRLKILKAHLEALKLVLDLVQLEGKNPVSWEEFKRGYPQSRLS